MPSVMPHAHPPRAQRFDAPRKAHVRRATDRAHPCWLCRGTIEAGATCLALRVPAGKRGSLRAYVCTGCIANRGGPNYRTLVARGWFRSHTIVELQPEWIDPADPFGERETS